MKECAMRLACLAVALVGLVLASDAQADARIRAGRWEVTAKMDLGGMELPPGIPIGQPIQTVSCISEEEASRSNEEIPVPADSKCTPADRQWSGNKLTYTMKCSGSLVKVELTIESPEAYTGKTTTTAEGQTMTMNFKGRRTGGACSAAEQAEDDARK
jgi:hypothetical protein